MYMLRANLAIYRNNQFIYTYAYIYIHVYSVHMIKDRLYIHMTYDNCMKCMQLTMHACSLGTYIFYYDNNNYTILNAWFALCMP